MALEDHIELSEVLALLNDLLVGKEDVAVEVTDEIADEFIACLCTFVPKHVLKIFDEGLEEVVGQRKSQTRFELVKEDVAFDDSIVV